MVGRGGSYGSVGDFNDDDRASDRQSTQSYSRSLGQNRSRSDRVNPLIPEDLDDNEDSFDEESSPGSSGRRRGYYTKRGNRKEENSFGTQFGSGYEDRHEESPSYGREGLDQEPRGNYDIKRRGPFRPRPQYGQYGQSERSEEFGEGRSSGESSSGGASRPRRVSSGRAGALRQRTQGFDE